MITLAVVDQPPNRNDLVGHVDTLWYSYMEIKSYHYNHLYANWSVFTFIFIRKLFRLLLFYSQQIWI